MFCFKKNLGLKTMPQFMPVTLPTYHIFAYTLHPFAYIALQKWLGLSSAQEIIKYWND